MVWKKFTLAVLFLVVAIGSAVAQPDPCPGGCQITLDNVSVGADLNSSIGVDDVDVNALGSTGMQEATLALAFLGEAAGLQEVLPPATDPTGDPSGGAGEAGGVAGWSGGDIPLAVLTSGPINGAREAVNFMGGVEAAAGAAGVGAAVAEAAGMFTALRSAWLLYGPSFLIGMACGDPCNGMSGGSSLSSEGSAGEAAVQEGNIVYRSVNAAEDVQYVGITNNLARRAADHLRTKGIQIEKLMGGLSRSDARAVEQALIEIHGLGTNGGTLLNRINSIAQSNPSYAYQVRRGYDLLRSIGYGQ
jgi:hypothetical protein